MAQYTKQQLISASNAAYFTNVYGGISASAVRDLNDSWISSSALLSGSNTFIGNQIISGTMTAQLPANYIWLGDSNGYNQAVATSSISLQGAQGIQGLQGLQGTQGIQGITGLQGLQGLQGIQGLQGTQGIQGITGLQGIQGIQGASGSQGIQGLQGLQGLQGIQGVSGSQGTQGLQGIQGADNSTQGTQGVQGLQGLQGLQGIQGISGSNGAQGIQGIQGADNSTQGTQGAQGFTGAQGIQGITGISGSNGAQGTQGIQGVQGTQGDNVSSGSLLVTASFANRNITFTKGDATTFDLPGFATTGSNTFNGNQTITGQVTISGSASLDLIVYGNVRVGELPVPPFYTNQNTLGLSPSSFVLTRFNQNQLGFAYDNITEKPVISAYTPGGIPYTVIQFQAATASYTDGRVTFPTPIVGLQNLELTGSLTASLQQGYAWVGDSNNRTTLVATSSFGGGGSIDTGSFATTGSNTFRGDQTINGILTVSSSANSYLQFTSPNNQTGSGQIFFGSLGPYIQTYSGGSSQDGMGLQLVGGLSGSFAMATRYGGPNATIELDAMDDQSNPATTRGRIQVRTNGQIDLTGFGGAISLSGSQTFIQGLRYPGTDGTAGQVLTTDGSGVLTFTTVSGSGGGTGSIDTGSFATTGSNVFTGDQTISKNGGVYNIIDNSNPSFGTASFGISGASGGLVFKQSGSIVMEGSFPKNLTFYGTGSFVRGIKISDSDFTQGATIIYNTTTNTFRMLDESAAVSNLELEGTFTASLANGFTYVGNASGVSTLVATSSFGSSINTGSFAITGSNVFTGKQTIPALDMSGSITFPNGAVIGPNSVGQATLISSQTALQLSSSVNATIFASALTFDALRTDVKGVETIGDMSRTANGEVYLLGRSGSLIIGNSTSTSTYAGLSHLSSSQINSNTNLIFKTNSSTGTTIISGSGNIFTNPNTPTTGYIRYIGGANNLYLNHTNGINSQITASAAASGVRPVMNNNIFQGTANIQIDQAVNPGAQQTYSNNIFAGINTTTINALAFTGSSFTVSDNIFKGGVVTINPASASLAEIAAGVSGSGGGGTQIDRNTILGTGGMTINIGPKVNSGFTGIISNVINAGQLTITNISSSTTVNSTGNFANGAMTYTNAGAAGLALHRITGTMNSNYGSMSLIASASAITAVGNICTSALTVTNRMYSGALGSGSVSFNNNQVQGAGNTYTVSGSYNGTVNGATFVQNAVFGTSNTFFTNVEGRGNYTSFAANGIFGQSLILTGSNNVILSEQGGAHIGRWNADDGRRNTTGENIFSVGTGTSTARKTGFLIDSGSNSYFEGTLNVSGSTALTGSLAVSSFTTLASVSSSLNFADDTAAAAGGVPLGGLYRNGNFVMIRLT